MASVFNVAKYILQKCGTMSTMKLEKLTYYCQAWSLAWDDKPLFDEDFEAWANGPVCPQLFARHKGCFIVDGSLLSSVEDYEFAKDEVETMNAVIDYYKDETPHYLSELTHQERPWKETRGNLPLGASSNKVIPKELMQEYYSGL